MSNWRARTVSSHELSINERPTVGALFYRITRTAMKCDRVNHALVIEITCLREQTEMTACDRCSPAA